VGWKTCLMFLVFFVPPPLCPLPPGEGTIVVGQALKGDSLIGSAHADDKSITVVVSVEKGE
jgi:hypothetical protein